MFEALDRLFTHLSTSKNKMHLQDGKNNGSFSEGLVSVQSYLSSAIIDQQ